MLSVPFFPGSPLPHRLEQDAGGVVHPPGITVVRCDLRKLWQFECFRKFEAGKQIHECNLRPEDQLVDYIKVHDPSACRNCVINAQDYIVQDHGDLPHKTEAKRYLYSNMFNSIYFRRVDGSMENALGRKIEQDDEEQGERTKERTKLKTIENLIRRVHWHHSDPWSIEEVRLEPSGRLVGPAGIRADNWEELSEMGKMMEWPAGFWGN